MSSLEVAVPRVTDPDPRTDLRLCHATGVACLAQFTPKRRRDRQGFASANELEAPDRPN